jgi:hypothetical protein
MNISQIEEKFDKEFIGDITTPTVHSVVQNQWFAKDIEINGKLVKSFLRSEITDLLDGLRREYKEKNFGNIGENAAISELNQSIAKAQE